MVVGAVVKRPWWWPSKRALGLVNVGIGLRAAAQVFPQAKAIRSQRPWDSSLNAFGRGRLARR